MMQPRGRRANALRSQNAAAIRSGDADARSAKGGRYLPGRDLTGKREKEGELGRLICHAIEDEFHPQLEAARASVRPQRGSEHHVIIAGASPGLAHEIGKKLHLHFCKLSPDQKRRICKDNKIDLGTPIYVVHSAENATRALRRFRERQADGIEEG